MSIQELIFDQIEKLVYLNYYQTLIFFLSLPEKRLKPYLKSKKMIYVVGHASQRTVNMDYAKHKLVNFGVSLDRANRVANELRRRGVSSEN